MLLKPYYYLKPYIPRWAQLAVRRYVMGHRRRKYSSVWPIDPQVGTAPEGWPGWPDGKRFAFVLTHDVEAQRGCDKSLALAALEERQGFRSSFNFVAEEYSIPSALRFELQDRGFEVGIHGITHDGHLYRSRSHFMQQAERINAYLKEWQVVGFRSPAMHRNFEWIGELDIEYDASSFDTDPFEPYPKGVGKIFPFHVGPPISGRRYVELPYSLAQDFTLLVVLQEKNTDIWRRKLDWIAEKGGMALIITHPDYMTFDSARPRVDEYPASLYEEFLSFVKDRYAGEFWHALPRDVARFWNTTFNSSGELATRFIRQESSQQGAQLLTRNPRMPASQRRPLRVAMVAYSFYETDNRIMRYAEALADRGDQVDVLALKKDGGIPVEKIHGVTLHRLQKRDINERSKYSYLWRMLAFFARSSFFLAAKHLRKPYDLIHVHSLPDFEVFAALLPKLMGAKVILDVHDIVPEFYASKFGVSKQSPTFKALQHVEKWSAAFADHVIIANHLWEKVITARSVAPVKCSTYLNYPDSGIFNTSLRTRVEDGLCVMLYPGSLNRHQGLDIAVKAFARIKDRVPEARFDIYGSGAAKAEIARLIEDNRLQDRVRIMPSLPLREIAGVMANADIGVVPKRDESFGGEAFSTKIFEFMALGVPIIAANTRIDRYYFNDSLLKFFQAGDEESLAEAMVCMVQDQTLRKRLAGNALAYVAQQSWDIKRKDYFDLVDQLVTSKK